MQERGFSLIEMLIVIAIILIIAAIVIPSLLHSKIAANEASAVGSIRIINTAQTTYLTAYPKQGYAYTLNQLASPAGTTTASSANAGILDWVLGCTSGICQKSGYNFQLANVPSAPPADETISTYSVWGTPVTIGTTGYRGFCSDNTNSILVDPLGGSACTVPLQ